MVLLKWLLIQMSQIFVESKFQVFYLYFNVVYVCLFDRFVIVVDKRKLGTLIFLFEN